MYYKLNKHIFIRKINNKLFLENKLTEEIIHGDNIAYIFLKYLSYTPQHINIILNNIISEFDSATVDKNEIREDLIQFLIPFIDSSIVAYGLTELDCNKNETKFSYKNIKLNNYNLEQKDTSETLIEIAKENSSNPQLIYVMLEITKYCNERCLHCYIPHENKNIILTDENFYKIIDECKKLETVCAFRISGGECMTHPSFKKYIKYIKDNGFGLTVLTNLTLLDDEIISILQEGTLSDVQVSLFSLDEKIHDKITTIPGSLKKTLMNLEKLYNADIPVAIATQAMELNKNCINDIFKYAQEHNFKMNFDWTIVRKEDTSTDNLDLRIQDLSNYSDICETKSKYNLDFKDKFKEDFSLPKNPEKFLCNAGINGLHITPNLKVTPCPGWNLYLGDLNFSSLQEVWETSSELKRIRQIRLKDFIECSNCDKSNVCNICMAQAYNENNGKFEISDYVCKMYDVIKKTILDY